VIFNGSQTLGKSSTPLSDRSEREGVFSLYIPSPSACLETQP
jgi:hypothetical protein